MNIKTVTLLLLIIYSVNIAEVSATDLPINATSNAINMTRLISETNILISEGRDREIVKIELTEKSQKPVYSVKATKKVRLLYIFRVSMDVEKEIDAETGEVLSEKKPWWNPLTVPLPMHEQVADKIVFHSVSLVDSYIKQLPEPTSVFPNGWFSFTLENGYKIYVGPALINGGVYRIIDFDAPDNTTHTIVLDGPTYQPPGTIKPELVAQAKSELAGHLLSSNMIVTKVFRDDIRLDLSRTDDFETLLGMIFKSIDAPMPSLMSVERDVLDAKPTQYDFAVYYSFGVGEKNMFDSERVSKGYDATYIKDMVCNPAVKYKVDVTDEEMEAINRAISENDFFNIGDDFTKNCDSKGICKDVSPLSTATLKVVSGGKTKTVKWSAAYSGDDEAGLKRFKNVETAIRNIISEKEREMAIPQPKCGYQ